MANLPTKDELLAQLNGIYDAARLKGEDVDSMPPPGVLLAQLLGMSTEEEVRFWENLECHCAKEGVAAPPRPPHLRR